MSTELPLLPPQLLDLAEQHLAEGRDEAAAQTFSLLAVHAQHLAASIRQHPGDTGDHRPGVLLGCGPVHPVTVAVRESVPTSGSVRRADPTPDLIRHAVHVVIGLTELAVRRAAATRYAPNLPLAATQARDSGTGVVRVVPDIGAVLDQMSQLWWERLSGPEQVAVCVHDLCHARPAIPVDDVLAACRLAIQHRVADLRLGEHTTYTLGNVEPGDPGVWTAQVGNAPHRPPVGDYGSIRAAVEAVWDTIAVNRQNLRDQLRAASTPLARLVGHAWTDPTVTVIASRAQRAADDPDLVTTGQIAHRARVTPADARTWAACEHDFPRPADYHGRTWRWPQIDEWLIRTGRKPSGGYAPDRPDLADDARF